MDAIAETNSIFFLKVQVDFQLVERWTHNLRLLGSTPGTGNVQ